MQIELVLIVAVKALAELAGMFLLGRGALYVLAGEKRDRNIFYQVLCIVTNPLIRLTRWVTPKAVLDRHVPFVAFLIVVWIWIAVVFWILPEACGSASIDCSPLLERKRQG